MATTGKSIAKVDVRTSVLSPATTAILRDFVAHARATASPRTLLVVGDASAAARAASTIAQDLGRDLLRVSLAAMGSHAAGSLSIGETGTNLERAFGAAKAGDVILFFDEADALFGKRTDVKDSHDRYANLDVAALLQRIESQPGVVIVATRRKADIDASFLRRTHAIVSIDPPD